MYSQRLRYDTFPTYRLDPALLEGLDLLDRFDNEIDGAIWHVLGVKEEPARPNNPPPREPAPTGPHKPAIHPREPVQPQHPAPSPNPYVPFDPPQPTPEPDVPQPRAMRRLLRTR